MQATPTIRSVSATARRGGPDGAVRERRALVRAYEAFVALPVLAFLVAQAVAQPEVFTAPGLALQIAIWIAAIAVVDLVPVPPSMAFGFRLSFPLELSVALLYPPPIACLIVLIASVDRREVRRALPPLTALFLRAQVALAVLAESRVFHGLAELDDRWYVVGPVVLLASVAGYTVTTLLVAEWHAIRGRVRVESILRRTHGGVLGEFVVSYMGLALFSVIVAITAQRIGLSAIVVFVAPLAFAWQMLRRTHSLQVASEELARRQRENEHQAFHDSLTGLPNRLLFRLSLGQAIERAIERDARVAVMLMDLDHFKEINDALGHHVGDRLLAAVGPRLAETLGERDLMSRLGGDEFGVLLTDVPDEAGATAIAERLLRDLHRPVAVDELHLDVSGSIGIALFPDHGEDADTLLRHADVAMYAAKEAGLGFELYDEVIDRHKPELVRLISQIRPAIDDGQFRMYYQPKVRLSDGRVAGAEALIRWHHPTLGRLGPADFLPTVERTVLLQPLTHWALNDVLRTWRSWSAEGVEIPVAVNVSPRTLLDQDLPDVVERLLERWGVSPRFLRLELTEDFLVADSGRSHAVLERLARVGIGLSIDDFGTGFSSLSYLKRLPIEEIKIDRTFVSNMLGRVEDFSIVRATIELGRNLGLRVVAEGVQDRETFDRLGDFGCDEAQGFYIAPALEPDDFWTWLSKREAHRSAPPHGLEAAAGRGGRLHAV
jgi:diguanylate cyclase (GGDEF)-like protein